MRGGSFSSRSQSPSLYHFDFFYACADCVPCFPFAGYLKPFEARKEWPFQGMEFLLLLLLTRLMKVSDLFLPELAIIKERVVRFNSPIHSTFPSSSHSVFFFSPSPSPSLFSTLKYPRPLVQTVVSSLSLSCPATLFRFLLVTFSLLILSLYIRIIWTF